METRGNKMNEEENEEENRSYPISTEKKQTHREKLRRIEHQGSVGL